MMKQNHKRQELLKKLPPQMEKIVIAKWEEARQKFAKEPKIKVEKRKPFVSKQLDVDAKIENANKGFQNICDFIQTQTMKLDEKKLKRKSKKTKKVKKKVKKNIHKKGEIVNTQTETLKKLRYVLNKAEKKRRRRSKRALSKTIALLTETNEDIDARIASLKKLTETTKVVPYDYESKFDFYMKNERQRDEGAAEEDAALDAAVDALDDVDHEMTDALTSVTNELNAKEKRQLAEMEEKDAQYEKEHKKDQSAESIMAGVFNMGGDDEFDFGDDFADMSDSDSGEDSAVDISKLM